MTTRIIHFRLHSADAERFVAVAKRSRARTPSQLLRQLVQQVILTNPLLAQSESVPAAAQSARPAQPTRQVNFRLPVKELEAAQTVAAAYGGVTRWVRALVQERLGQASERLATDEIKALYEATLELSHIGNNLNQVARELHTARLEGQPLPAHKVDPQLLAEMMHKVDTLAGRARALVSAARKRSHHRV